MMKESNGAEPIAFLFLSRKEATAMTEVTILLKTEQDAVSMTGIVSKYPYDVELTLEFQEEPVKVWPGAICCRFVFASRTFCTTSNNLGRPGMP